jgi:3'-5' exonuclease
LSPESGPIGPGPTGRGPSGPKRGAVPPTTTQEPARENDPNDAQTGPEGPKGPFLEGGTAEQEEEQGAQHLLDTEPLLINSEVAVHALLPELDSADFVALDLETTGLDPRRDRIRLLTLATERGVWLVDCFQIDPHPLFPVLAGKTLEIHNALFDLAFLFRMGFEPGENFGVRDTMLLSQMVKGLRPTDEEDA